MSRLIIILYTLDSFMLALLTLGHCRIGETLSSVAFITEQDGKWIGKIMRPVIDTIMWFDKDHCYQSWIMFRKITGDLL